MAILALVMLAAAFEGPALPPAGAPPGIASRIWSNPQPVDAQAVLAIWPVAEREFAACVAYHESRWQPLAHNGDDPYGGSFGLFQINAVHAPAFPSLWWRWSDPVANATMAHALWRERGWQPWLKARSLCSPPAD